MGGGGIVLVDFCFEREFLDIDEYMDTQFTGLKVLGRGGNLDLVSIRHLLK